MTHDDVTGGSSAPADKGTDRRSTQSQSAASPGLPTTRAWQRADERPGTRACSPATICVLWRQGLCRAWGVGPCLCGIVAGQGVATATWASTTTTRNQTHLDIKTHPSCYGSAEAELALSIRFTGVLAGTKV